MLRWFKPQFNELITFESVVICIVLLIAYPELRLTYKQILQDSTGVGAWIAVMSLLAVIGMFFSIWHVFTTRKKHALETYFMGAFALSVNGLAGIAAGIEMLPDRWSIMALFPIWNIISGVILFYEMGFIENIITDENATWLEVVIATFGLLVVFTIADYGLHLTWAMTLSVCLLYISIMSMFISWLINRFHL